MLQKVRFERKQYDVMTKFEKQHHPDIWKFVLDKVFRIFGHTLQKSADSRNTFVSQYLFNHTYQVLLNRLTRFFLYIFYRRSLDFSSIGNSQFILHQFINATFEAAMRINSKTFNILDVLLAPVQFKWNSLER